MNVTRISNRGFIFTFDDLQKTNFQCSTNVYAIVGNKYIFICDTCLGPDSMAQVIDHLKNLTQIKPLIIFNSHADWDHIWGNCYFPNSLIIAHHLCRQRIQAEGERDLLQYSLYCRGEVELVLPNLTFDTEIVFPGEGIKFFYSPGHTIDSASCYDMIDHLLFVGDNLEDPIPYISIDNLAQYRETLEGYLKLSPDIYLPAHSAAQTTEHLLRKNLDYLRSLMSARKYLPKHSDYPEKFDWIHQSNLQVLKKE